ncbi:predicted protein [Naegleria gruberi]|nr:uncharacterized protein NAEGRDRAFT_76770 [Naegleria gruberi]EFC35574.1 predicted protein [Naegleria gruberi]|eukprot:XP_002668318.1 predicted protein [Naegleria gruberi strain NEG-M]
MTKYVIELVYKSMASFASYPKKGNKYYIPEIANQFISGKCFLKNGEYKFIVTLRKSNGGKFKLLMFFPDHINGGDDEEVYGYQYFRILLLDKSENKFLRECYSNRKRKIQKKVKQFIDGILEENLDFESICACIVGLVYSRGYLVNYMKPGKRVWKNVQNLVPRKRKTKSAPIQAGQIGDDGLDLDPLTIFWIDEELTAAYDYGDVKTIKNPKIKDEAFEYVSNLIANYRAINRDDIDYQTYGAYKDAHALYSEPIVDVHDFDYQEKSLYYVNGRHHYCVIVSGYDEIVICGEASNEIFYWTPYCFFRVGEPEEGTCDETDTNYDYSHLKPLKELQSVTFDNVLENIEEFFAQFK